MFTILDILLGFILPISGLQLSFGRYFELSFYLRACANRKAAHEAAMRPQEARSFGEFSKLPDEGVHPCPLSHHTSSSLSGSSSRPCCPKQKWTILSAVTGPAYPTAWSFFEK